MLEIIITSSILILIVVALRFLLRGKLSPTVIYALWAIVALRLLLPFNFFDSRASVMNLFESKSQQQSSVNDDFSYSGITDEGADSEIAEGSGEAQQDGVRIETDISAPEQITIPVPSIPEENHQVQENVSAPHKSVPTDKVITAVWLTGTVLVLGWAVVTNVRFGIFLKKNRRPASEVNTDLPVYIVDELSSPCLFGFIRPVIYLNGFAAEDRKRTGYVLTHELVHYRHFDHVWSVLRVICAAIYWFNPLVWIAASVSRKDSELACDSAVAKAVGDEYRIEYGRTLVDMLMAGSASADVMLTSTTMSGSGRTVKERLQAICSNPRTVKWAAAVVSVVLIAALAVTFTGAVDRKYKESTVEVISVLDVFSSASDVDLKGLPEEFYCSIYNESDSRLHDAYITTVNDLVWFMDILDEARGNPVKVEDIPANSWKQNDLTVNYFDYFCITGDGYVVEYQHDTGGYDAEEIHLNIGDFFDQICYEGYYWTYKIPDSRWDAFVERLMSCTEKQQVQDPPGAGEIELYYPAKATIMLYDGSSDEPFEICSVKEFSGAQRVGWALNLCSWKTVAPEELPDTFEHTIRIVLNNSAQIIDISADGLVKLWEPSSEFFTGEAYLEVEENGIENCPEILDEYPGSCWIRRMDPDVLRSLLTVINSLVSSQDTVSYPDVIAEYSLNYDATIPGRAHNIETAAEYIDGTVLMPGEEFSFNDVVGKRTPERGFMEAVLPIEEDDGEKCGGVGLTATVLYNAAFRAGMDITEYRNNMYCVTYLHEGMVNVCGIDAAVTWGYSDLRFVNRSEHPVRIDVTCERSEVTVRIMGISNGERLDMILEEVEIIPYSTVFYPEEEGKTTQQGIDGRVFNVYRGQYSSEGIDMRDFVLSVSYRPLNQIVYTNNLPEGIEYGVVYDDFSPNVGHDLVKRNPSELWDVPGLHYLLGDVPVFDVGTLEAVQHYLAGVPSSEEDDQIMYGHRAEMDMVSFRVGDIDSSYMSEFKKRLTQAGFTYFAPGESIYSTPLTVAYNAPAYGIGIQIECYGDARALITVFAQRDKCYGSNEPIPKG